MKKIAVIATTVALALTMMMGSTAFAASKSCSSSHKTVCTYVDANHNGRCDKCNCKKANHSACHKKASSSSHHSSHSSHHN